MLTHIKCKTSKKQIIIRDIVVGLFHLAGIEEDEDLLYSCTEDVRSNVDRNCHAQITVVIIMRRWRWRCSDCSHPRATVDQDGDGDISKEEFVKNAMNSKFIHDMLVEKSQV